MKTEEEWLREDINTLQAEIEELRAALADRDAKLFELHLQYISDFGQLQAQEPAAMYLRECTDGSLVQLYDDLKPGTKLYAAAGAQEQRKPLTDEEISEIALDYSLPYSIQSFARAIEAKIKEQP